jgi:hypothetical protein
MCRPARSDSHLGAAVTVVAVAAVTEVIMRPVLHAAVTALEVALITAAVAAGVAALAAVAFIVIRVHRRQARALARLSSSRAVAAGQPVAAIPALRLLAIEAPRPGAADALGLEDSEPVLVRWP